MNGRRAIAVRRRALVALAAAAALWATPPAPAAPQPARWCGADAMAADRQDAVSAFQVHVLYAVPADAPDRFAERALPIARDLAAIDGWWQRQDPTRAPRFDLATFAGCDSAFGALDIGRVLLPGTSARYAAQDRGFGALVGDLGQAYADPDKKYVVFFEGALSESSICGASPSEAHIGGRSSFAVVYLGSACAGALGDATDAASTAAHELLHNLGALPRPPGPPHACPDDPGHPCDDETDILFPYARPGTALDAHALDSGRDDYYGHSGSWWDVQDSPYLARLDSVDASPPRSPTGLTASSRGSAITVSWTPSTNRDPVTYRLYRGNDHFASTSAPSGTDFAPDGVTIAYTVRAADGAGYLSPRLTIRFTVGLGIVDERGALLRDTVPPPPVTGLRADAGPRMLVLSWNPVADAGGLRGYRVERNGRSYGPLRTRPTAAIPKRGARGEWRVRAVDRAGNQGPARVVRW
jgi:hypothetical protein